MDLNHRTPICRLRTRVHDCQAGRAAQARLQQDVNAIEAGNATTRKLNARLAESLRRVRGKDLGDDKEA